MITCFRVIVLSDSGARVFVDILRSDDSMVKIKNKNFINMLLIQYDEMDVGVWQRISVGC